jgi:hypothetical protein
MANQLVGLPGLHLRQEEFHGSHHHALADLPYPSWRNTATTLQLWTQIIVGKVRLTPTPWINHSWQVPLYVTARGLGTSPIPVGNEILEIEFDFISHRLIARTSLADERAVQLVPQTVADFHRRLIEMLNGIGVAVDINEMPNEVANPISSATGKQRRENLGRTAMSKKKAAD